MKKAYIAAGSNLGNREDYLNKALKKLEGHSSIRVIKKSSIYETEPVGGPSQGKYLNAVWEVETQLDAKSLLEFLLSVEKELGRERKGKNAPRTIDLDLLDYENRILEEKGLTLPHPRLKDREFVLRPLAEIAPNWKHPVLNKTVKEL